MIKMMAHGSLVIIQLNLINKLWTVQTSCYPEGVDNSHVGSVEKLVRLPRHIDIFILQPFSVLFLWFFYQIGGGEKEVVDLECRDNFYSTICPQLAGRAHSLWDSLLYVLLIVHFILHQDAKCIL